jgi:hypothetical protein
MKTIVEIQVHAMANTWCSEDVLLYKEFNEDRSPAQLLKHFSENTRRKFTIGKNEELTTKEYPNLPEDIRYIRLEERSSGSLYSTIPETEKAREIAQEILYKIGCEDHPPQLVYEITKAKEKKETARRFEAGCIFGSGYLKEEGGEENELQGSLSDNLWEACEAVKGCGDLSRYAVHYNRTHKTDRLLNTIADKLGNEAVVKWMATPDAVEAMDYIDPFISSPLFNQTIKESIEGVEKRIREAG